MKAGRSCGIVCIIIVKRDVLVSFRLSGRRAYKIGKTHRCFSASITFTFINLLGVHQIFLIKIKIFFEKISHFQCKKVPGFFLGPTAKNPGLGPKSEPELGPGESLLNI